MSKISYKLLYLLCLYMRNKKNIKELEKIFKALPYKDIKEQIIACLNIQKDLLKKINSCDFSKLPFKANKQHIKESKILENINAQVSKVIKSKKSSKATYKFATSLLIASLLMGVTSSSTGKCMREVELTPKLTEELLDSNVLTQETVEVKIPTTIGSQKLLTVHTLELENKHYDINCPEELQDYFYELEEKWGIIPAELAMLIVDQESDGQWNTNGVISPTNDYGLSQINKQNHEKIFKVLGYTSDDLKNDPYKNLDAMFYLLTRIFNLYGYTKDNYDIENVCGTYNGHIYWRDKEQSVDYVNECMERYYTIFAEDKDKEKLLVRSAY